MAYHISGIVGNLSQGHPWNGDKVWVNKIYPYVCERTGSVITPIPFSTELDESDALTFASREAAEHFIEYHLRSDLSSPDLKCLKSISVERAA